MKIATKQLTICTATLLGLSLGIPTAFAQSFNAPGTHTYWVSSGTDVRTGNSIIPSGTEPNTTTNAPNLRQGIDWLMGSQLSKSMSWPTTQTKTGYAPVNVGDVIASCNTGTCSSAVSAGTNNCTIQETTHGINGSSDLLGVANISLSYETKIQSESCSSTSTTYTATISASNFPAGYKLYPVVAVGYRQGTGTFKGTKIYFSPSMMALATTDSRWGQMHQLCLSQGWESGSSQRNDVAYFRQTVKANGNNWCYIPNNTLVVKVRGSHPKERIATTVKIASSANPIVVGSYYSSSLY